MKLFMVALCAAFIISSLCGFGQPSAAVNVLFDTDMSSDCDDVGALAVLHTLADKGECTILGVGVCVSNPNTPACADAINTYYNRPNIPIGVWKGALTDPGSSGDYAYLLSHNFPNDLKNATSIPDVVPTYRSILAQQPDSSVTFVTVGYLNNIKALLVSTGDQYSSLSGLELVRKKCRLMVTMGGKFPSSTAIGCEWNFCSNGHGPESQYVVTNWPTPIIFSGAEIGFKIESGKHLYTDAPNSPVTKAYEKYNGYGNGRFSWDLTACLVAVRGIYRYFGYAVGTCQVTADGNNTWTNSGTKHRYLILGESSSSEIAAILDQLMACAPGSGSSCAPVPTTPAPAVSPNLAWGKTFVASPTGGSVSALNDGTADNYWYGSMPASVTVDLTETHAVNKIKIKVPSGWSDRSETIALLGSTDGSQFTVIKAAQAYQFTAAGASTVSIDFPATSYRYIRLTVSTNSGSGEAQLGEVLVYKQLTTTPTAIVSPQGAQSSQPRLSVDGSLINFTHSPATSWSFSVFNMQGQECFSRTDLRSASRIPDGTLKNGLHVVHVQSGSYKTSSEFLFMR